MDLYPTFEQAVSPDDTKKYVQYLAKVLSRFWTQLARIVNGNLEIYHVKPNGTTVNGNIFGYFFTGTIPTANSNFVITHTLMRVPKGFLIISINTNANIWLVTGSPTLTTITVQCSVASTNVQLFVI